MSPQCEVWAGGGQGLPGEGAVGLGRRRSNVSPLLMCSHLGRLWREPAHRSLPHPAPSKQDSQHSLCSLCPCQARRSHQWPGELSGEERKQSRDGTEFSPVFLLEQRPDCAAGPDMSHRLVLADAGDLGCWAPRLHVALPEMSRGTACEWLRTESGLMLLTS